MHLDQDRLFQPASQLLDEVDESPEPDLRSRARSPWRLQESRLGRQESMSPDKSRREEDLARLQVELDDLQKELRRRPEELRAQSKLLLEAKSDLSRVSNRCDRLDASLEERRRDTQQLKVQLSRRMQRFAAQYAALVHGDVHPQNDTGIATRAPWSSQEGSWNWSRLDGDARRQLHDAREASAQEATVLARLQLQAEEDRSEVEALREALSQQRTHAGELDASLRQMRQAELEDREELQSRTLEEANQRARAACDDYYRVRAELMSQEQHHSAIEYLARTSEEAIASELQAAEAEEQESAAELSSLRSEVEELQAAHARGPTDAVLRELDEQDATAWDLNQQLVQAWSEETEAVRQEEHEARLEAAARAEVSAERGELRTLEMRILELNQDSTAKARFTEAASLSTSWMQEIQQMRQDFALQRDELRAELATASSCDNVVPLQHSATLASLGELRERLQSENQQCRVEPARAPVAGTGIARALQAWDSILGSEPALLPDRESRRPVQRQVAESPYRSQFMEAVPGRWPEDGWQGAPVACSSSPLPPWTAASSPAHGCPALVPIRIKSAGRDYASALDTLDALMDGHASKAQADAEWMRLESKEGEAIDMLSRERHHMG